MFSFACLAFAESFTLLAPIEPLQFAVAKVLEGSYGRNGKEFSRRQPTTLPTYLTVHCFHLAAQIVHDGCGL